MIVEDSEKQKRYILYTLMALSTVPFFFIVNLPSWGLDTQSLKSLSLYGSAVAGYVGISMMLWQLALGTRSIVGLYFRDLTALLKLHRNIGKWGTLLIFLHPLLIILSYGEKWLYAAIPSLGTSFETQVTYGRLALYGLVVIWVTSALVRGKIAYRPWKYVHYIAYAVMPFALLHVPQIGSSFSNTLVQIYWYSFVFIFLLIVALRLRHVFGFGKQLYLLESQEQLTENTYVLTLLPQAKRMDVQAGQYVYIQPGLLHEEHPFTVLGVEPISGRMHIAYKTFGSFTKKLPTLPVESVLYVDGPYGTFTQQVDIDQYVPVVFIAGGIGITPFVQRILNRPSGVSRKLFYANTTKQSAIFRDALRRELGDDYIDVVSRDNTAASSHDERGHVSATMLSRYIEQPQDHHFFICGPQGFMDSSRAALLSLGVSHDNIHTEEFGF